MTAISRSHRAPGPSLWRRFAVRVLVAAVLAVLAGSAWVLFRPARDTALTSYGAPVANGPGLLSEAEHLLRQAVQQRHGSLADSARCYYESAGPAPAAHTAQPIGDRVFCGPVRFVDGSPDRPFLTFSLVAQDEPDGRMRLSLGDQDGDGTSADPRPAVRLIRPDGKAAPSSDRVRDPVPPAAGADLLTTTSTLPSAISAAPSDAVMVGQVSGVRLVEYGFVNSYGWGESARTTPRGYRLLAFATNSVPGEDADNPPDLSVRIDGTERGPLMSTSDYIVTTVPAKAKQVDLVLDDSGLKQSISLLTGQPASTNPAVTRRSHDRQTLNQTRSVKVQLKTSAGTGTVDGTLQFRQVSLSYWAADGRACRQPDRAWLHVGAVLKLDGDPQFYGVEPGLLSAAVPGAAGAGATNAADDPNTGVDDVVDVPAGTTSGIITFSGSVKTAKGTLTVLTPVKLPFTIPAG